VSNWLSEIKTTPSEEAPASPSHSDSSHSPRLEEAFNPYARFASDSSSSIPSVLLHGGTADDESSATQHASPSPTTNPYPRSLSQPGSLLLSKPFRCPNPNCTKAYKQVNALKYHMIHGTCNVSVSYVKDLEERRMRQGMSSTDQHQQLITSPSASTTPPSSASSSSAPSSPFTRPSPPPQSAIKQNDHLLLPSAIPTYSDLSKLSEHDPRVEAEWEVVRPYRCGVGDCQRRYKNINGLRYHYHHSGDHGEMGLALLASGQHECLGSGPMVSTISKRVLAGWKGYNLVSVAGAKTVTSGSTSTPEPKPT